MISKINKVNSTCGENSLALSNPEAHAYCHPTSRLYALQAQRNLKSAK